MDFNQNNLKSGMKLWFRKKGSWQVDYLTVCVVEKHGFSFRLSNGRVAKCSFAYASGRLYPNRESLSTYAEVVPIDRTYDGWAGSPLYSNPFTDDEVEHLKRVADQLVFSDD